MKLASVFAGAALGAVLFSGASQAAVIVTSYATWVADVAGQFASTTSTGQPDLTSPIGSVLLTDGTVLTLSNGAIDTVVTPATSWSPLANGYTGQLIDTSNIANSSNTETITFGPTPINAFGMIVSPDLPFFGPYAETFTVTLSDGTSTTISGTYPYGGVNGDPATTQFIGFVGGGISSITVSTTNSPDFAYGNFVDAPEPVSLTLLASGLAFLGVVRRRGSANLAV